MTKVLVEDSNLTSIANAIREKNGQTTQYKPSEMGKAIDNIKTGEKPTETIEITKNGVYDVVDYATANVNTPEPKEEQSKSITITENGTQNITPDENKVLSNVEVITDVPVGVFPTGNIEIIENGTYDVTNYASANVNVPSKITQPKTITENGVYNATDDGVDGYDVVTVETGKYAPRYIRFERYTGTELDNEINNLDFINITDAAQMFCDCQKLISLPQFKNANFSNLNRTFDGCRALLEIPSINTSNCVNFAYAFRSCQKAQIIPLLDLGKSLYLTDAFQSCNQLTNMGGLQNLGKAYKTTINANNYTYTLNLSTSKLLTHESLMNVINKLYDIASKGVPVQQLVLGADNLAKLSAEEIAIATNKGWTVS